MGYALVTNYGFADERDIVNCAGLDRRPADNRLSEKGIF